MTFEEFVTARLSALLRYAMAIAGDAEAARDAVQDALIKAYPRWRRITRLDLDPGTPVAGTVSGRPAYAVEGGSTIVVPGFHGNGVLVVQDHHDTTPTAELLKVAQGIRWTG